MGFGRDAIFALLRRPVLLVEALRTSLAMRRKGGFGPARPYLSWRSVTAYGDDMTTVGAQDLLNYLSWRREMRAIRKWEREA